MDGNGPDGVECITQDNGSSIYKGVAFGYHKTPYLKKNIWLANNGTGHADAKIKKYDAVAEDWDTAIITRDHYESALAAKNDGWIEWGGGECPVPCGTAVDVKHRCGAVSENQQAWPKHHKESDVVVNPFSNAGQAFWRHENSVVDIIAYRLHHPQEVTKADDEADLNECIGQAPETEWNGEGLPPVGCECEARFRHRNSAEWMYFRCVAVDCDVAFGWAGKDAVALEWESYQFRPIRSEADKKRGAICDAIYGALTKAEREHNRSDEAEAVYDAIAAGKIPGVKLED